MFFKNNKFADALQMKKAEIAALQNELDRANSEHTIN
jgi:hypothetical protein